MDAIGLDHPRTQGFQLAHIGVSGKFNRSNPVGAHHAFEVAPVGDLQRDNFRH